MNSWAPYLVEVSGHKLKSSHTWVFVWFSTLIFPFYKRLFMNRLESSCFADFLYQSRVWFSVKSVRRTGEGTVHSMEQKTRVFCQIDDQEFHLRIGSVHFVIVGLVTNKLCACAIPWVCKYENWEAKIFQKFFIYILFGGLQCVGHSFTYVAHFVFLRDVWIRTQRAARSKQVRYPPISLFKSLFTYFYSNAVADRYPLYLFG